MKGILSVTGVALACAVSLAAQSTPPQPAPSSQGQPKVDREQAPGKAVTLTGCLREAEEPNTYILANVDMTHVSGPAGTAGRSGGGSPKPTPGGTPTSPETGGATSGSGATSPLATGGSTGTGRIGASGGPMDKANSVKLVGNADLQAHLGHEIQVTGTMVPQGGQPNPAASGAGTTGSATGESTTDTTSRAGESRTGAGTNMHTMRVQTVKMVGADCVKR